MRSLFLQLKASNAAGIYLLKTRAEFLEALERQKPKEAQETPIDRGFFQTELPEDKQGDKA